MSTAAVQELSIPRLNIRNTEFDIRLREPGTKILFPKKGGSGEFDKNYELRRFSRTRIFRGIPSLYFHHALYLAARLCGYIGFPRGASWYSLRGIVGIDTCIHKYCSVARMTMVRLSEGEPQKRIYPCRITRGDRVVEERKIPKWFLGPDCKVNLHVYFDADQFTLGEVRTLMEVAGAEIGIGDLRPQGGGDNGRFKIV